MKKNRRARVWKALFLVLVFLLVVWAGLQLVSLFGLGAAVGEWGENWMFFLRDDVALSNVVIPGAHDAGSYDYIWAARTQDFDTAAQLAAGVRYLDLRVTRSDAGELVMFHGVTRGNLLGDVLDDCAAFLRTHSSETLLLDFTNLNGVFDDVHALLLERLGVERMVRNDTALPDPAFIESLTVGQARGKAVVFWGSQSDKNLAMPYLFRRNNDAGDRTDCSLFSFYREDLHTRGSATLTQQALPLYLERFRASGARGVFVLQCQLTDPVAIIGPRFYETLLLGDMDAWLADLPQHPRDLAVCNVVLRDFLTADKTAPIIALNDPKGNLKPKRRDAFLKKLQLES